MECLCDNLNFDGCFTVLSDGRGSGLALLWKPSENFWVDSFSNYHIDVIFFGKCLEINGVLWGAQHRLQK